MSSNLGMVEAKLPPGFRFHPRDIELICDYLMKKIGRCEQEPLLLIEVDLNKSEPWDIPERACVGGREWYFYSQRDRKYATGCRTNRATVSGYWKATGKDRPIIRGRDNRLVGMRKTLVFYEGRAPKGKKTNWVMHEFRLEGSLAPPQISSLKEDWVLCRMFYKSREVEEEVASAKQGIGSSSCDETTRFSSLPPLMDSYIAFDQSQTSNYNEQVPCFSIVSTSNQTNSSTSTTTTTTATATATATTATNTLSNMDLQYPPLIIPSTTSTMPLLPMTMPELFAAYLNVPNSSSSGDKEAVVAVINHLNKMDTNTNPNAKELLSSFGEGISSESLLSDVGMPSTPPWPHY